MREHDDTPLSDEEQALAREGEARIAAAVSGVRAPQSLREGIEREREAAARPAPSRRRRWALAGIGVAATVAAVAGTLAITGGGDVDPTLDDVYAAAAVDPAAAAPATLGGEPPVLDARVDAVDFPDWREAFDWTATGRTDDELSGRDITTVYYRNPDETQLAYAVLGGDALTEDPPGREVERDGNTYRVAREGDRTVVTWEQQGQTCVIVAPAVVRSSTLVDLAASRDT